MQPKVRESHFDAIVSRGESIQAAIDKAPENGSEPYRILVRKGLYNQKVIIDRPNIVLVGEQRDSCIIVGAEGRGSVMVSEFRGEKAPRGIISLTEKADDCLISGLTVINNYGTTVSNTTSHQFAVFGKATRTIIINSNIISDGNDALSALGQGEKTAEVVSITTQISICAVPEWISSVRVAPAMPPAAVLSATHAPFSGMTDAEI